MNSKTPCEQLVSKLEKERDQFWDMAVYMDLHIEELKNDKARLQIIIDRLLLERDNAKRDAIKWENLYKDLYEQNDNLL